MIPRVYIAAPYQLQDQGKKLREWLRTREIDCTSQWLDNLSPTDAEAATRDLQDVMQAHAVIAINPEEFRQSGTGGRHVELGYALANSIPIFVLGCRSNVFHTLATLVEHEEDLIDLLRAAAVSYAYTHHVHALRAMFARVHRANRKWWIDIETGQPKERNFGELLMLVTSELSEALEGDRKRLPDDKLPHYDMRTVEIADALIRLFDIAGSGRYGNVADAFEDKMKFNAVREDHQHEHRQGAHGKKY